MVPSLPRVSRMFKEPKAETHLLFEPWVVIKPTLRCKDDWAASGEQVCFVLLFLLIITGGYFLKREGGRDGEEERKSLM